MSVSIVLITKHLSPLESNELTRRAPQMIDSMKINSADLRCGSGSRVLGGVGGPGSV